MTMLAIDPGTQSMGFAIWTDDAPVCDGVFTISWDAPSAFLLGVRHFLDKQHRAHAFTFIAIERMFVDTRFGGNRARLLNVIPDEVLAWCEERGIRCEQYGNSTVKRLVGGSGGAAKGRICQATAQYISDDARATWTKAQLADIADAHAIALTAIISKYGPAARAPKKRRSRAPRARG